MKRTEIKSTHSNKTPFFIKKQQGKSLKVATNIQAGLRAEKGIK